MAVDHSHCCEPETGDATTTGLDPEYELDFDPTLNSCCERDRAKHSFELKAKAALQRVDRVDLRTRLETGVLGRRPQECIEGSESSIGDPESDSHEGWLACIASLLIGWHILWHLLAGAGAVLVNCISVDCTEKI